MDNNTIISLSTPSGLGAVGIVRLSGENSLNIASSIFQPISAKSFQDTKPRYMHLGIVDADGIKDKCLAVFFKAPYSFTGENVVEFQCHGGEIILQGIIRKCVALGARLANNGEFSKRAFLNGKMDLSNVEGMADLINAESQASSKLAFSLFSGGLTQKIAQLQEELENSIAFIEASFDYPEEDVPPINVPEVTDILTSQISMLNNLLSTYTMGRTITNGVSVAILGKPNVGKSSLLNGILGVDRAIVTDIAGTTRDVLSAKYEYRGVAFELFDTAGIREASDVIEKIGIDKAKDLIERADILIPTFDCSRPLDQEDEEILQAVQNRPSLVVINKIDNKSQDFKLSNNLESIAISAKTGEGINELKEKLFELTNISKLLSTESLVLTSERHFSALKESVDRLQFALDNIDDLPADCIILDIRRAWELYGELTGTTASEHIIDTIFSKLCLGK